MKNLDPPIILDFSMQESDTLDESKYRLFSESDEGVDILVWPVLLYKGDVIQKGVVKAAEGDWVISSPCAQIYKQAEKQCPCTVHVVTHMYRKLVHRNKDVQNCCKMRLFYIYCFHLYAGNLVNVIFPWKMF